MVATTYTKDEIAAFHEKDNNPEKTVICPRCGTELEIEDHGSGYDIKCQTEGCLHTSVRGI